MLPECQGWIDYLVCRFLPKILTNFILTGQNIYQKDFTCSDEAAKKHLNSNSNTSNYCHVKNDYPRNYWTEKRAFKVIKSGV